MGWLTKRLGEPSTWAGGAVAAMGAGTFNGFSDPNFWFSVISCIAGVIAMFKGDPGTH